MSDEGATARPRIARIWRGRTTREPADKYAAYLHEHGIRPLEGRAPGVQLFRRDREERRGDGLGTLRPNRQS
jgi:hypothetical protein